MKKSLVFLVLLSLPVFSLSLTPPLESNELIFEPGEEIILNYVVKNNQFDPVAVEINVDTSRVPFKVSVGSTRRLLQAGENLAVPVSFTYPSHLSPGIYDLTFTANEIAENVGGMSAIAGVGNSIAIISPYPGSFVSGTIIARERYAPGEVIELRVNARNLGVSEVKDLLARAFVIVDGSERLLKEQKLGSLGALASNKFAVDIPTAGIKKGEHVLKVALYADGQEIVLVKNFILGTPSFEVAGTPRLVANKENAVLFNVTSDWNVPVKNATFRVVTSKNLFSAETKADLLPGMNEVELRGAVGSSQDDLLGAQFMVQNQNHLVTRDFRVEVEGGILSALVVRSSSSNESVQQVTGVSFGLVAVLVVAAGLCAFVAGRIFSRRPSQ